MDYSDFAHLYDSFVNFEDDLPFLAEECHNASGPVLELMAGTGRVTARLVASGLRPTSVDSSRNMLARLVEKLAAESPMVVCADVRALPFMGTFDIAVLPFNSFSEIVSPEDREVALRSIHGALAPGGTFICTLHNPAFRLRSVSLQPKIVAQFPDPSGSGETSVTVESRFDADTGVVTGIQSFTTRRAGKAEEELSVPLEFCLPSRAWFAKAACSAGFIVGALYGDYDRSDYHEENSRFMIWCLRKGAA